MNRFKSIHRIGLIGLIWAAGIAATDAQGGPYVYNGGVPITPPTFASVQSAAQATNTAPHLGFIGSNCRIDVGTSGHTEWMQRTFFVNTSKTPLTGAEVFFANFYDSGNGITAPGGNMYQTATLEFPSNTFSRITFNGLTNGIVMNGTWLVSDYVNFAVPVPPGAMYWVRSWMSNGVSSVCYIGPSYANTTYNESQAGPTVTDETGGGAPIGASQYWSPPLAVVGYTTCPSVLGIGDSGMTGEEFSGNGDPDPSAGFSRIFDANNYGFCNFGVSGESYTQWTIHNNSLMYFTNFATAVWNQLGINDIAIASQTAYFVETNLTFFATNTCPNLPVYGATFLPHQNTASVDNWTTLSGQTLTAGWEGQRVPFNASLRNHQIPGITGYVDLDACVESSTNSGLWAVNGNPGWLTSDGLHSSIYAGELEAQSLNDFLNGSRVYVPLQGGFVGGPLQLNGGAYVNNGMLTMRSNTFSVFALTNGLNNGDGRLLFSNGPTWTGAWVSCLWSNGVPITNYVAGASGGVLP